MMHESSSSNGVGAGGSDASDEVRDIHALVPPSPVVSAVNPARRREDWEAGSHHRSSSLSAASEVASSEHFSSMSREFNALVLAGSAMEGRRQAGEDGGMVNLQNLGRIGEEELEETNPLAIVPESSALPDRPPSPRRSMAARGSGEVLSVHMVKKEEVESKISAWQTAKVAKINNRFKREGAIISGCESEEVQKATTWMKKVERKLEEKRAKALEKMQNDVAKARRKAEEKRASAEAKRGTKVARVLELANLMKAVGRAPTKRSVF